MERFLKSNFRKIQIVSKILQKVIYFLTIRTTLNNFYLTITNNFGKVLFINSGGLIQISSLKRNTSYSLELALTALLKKVTEYSLCNFVVQLDFQTLKRKKLITKILKKFSIKVLALQILVVKSFNGVRLAKRRRI